MKCKTNHYLKGNVMKIETRKINKTNRGNFNSDQGNKFEYFLPFLFDFTNVP